MPIYEFVDEAGHKTEHLCSIGTNVHVCACGLEGHKVPSRFVQLNPPTGAAVRNHFSLYREATQELDHAAAKIEASTGQPVQSPDLWSLAKAHAQAIQDAGEAPPPIPLENTA